MDFLNSQWHSTLCVDSRTGGRAENQDCTASQDTPFGLLSVVCDGMGGGKAGRNASTLAAQAVLQYCKQAPAAKLPDVVLTEAVVYAQNVLRQNIKEHPELLGMGTTCVAALVTQKKAAIVHVGDSRCYVLRDGQVAFRTQDHSVVGEMVRKGELTEEDARRAQGSNVITRALGIKETVEPETHFIDILPDDRIVLCTDGLWGHFAEAELVRMCSLPQPTNVLLPLIMDQAEHHGQQQPDGNYDNLSLSIIQMNGPKTAKLTLARKAASPDTATAKPLPQPKAPQWRKPAFLIAAVLVVALTGIGSFYFGASRNGGEEDAIAKNEASEPTDASPVPTSSDDSGIDPKEINWDDTNEDTSIEEKAGEIANKDKEKATNTSDDNDPAMLTYNLFTTLEEMRNLNCTIDAQLETKRKDYRIIKKLSEQLVKVIGNDPKLKGFKPDAEIIQKKISEQQQIFNWDKNTGLPVKSADAYIVKTLNSINNLRRNIGLDELNIRERK